jgi:hypothetical protein
MPFAISNYYDHDNCAHEGVRQEKIRNCPRQLPRCSTASELKRAMRGVVFYGLKDENILCLLEKTNGGPSCLEQFCSSS